MSDKIQHDVDIQIQICTINTSEYLDYFLLMPDITEDQPWGGCLVDDIPEIADRIYDDLYYKAPGEYKWTLDLHIDYDEWTDCCGGHECSMEYSYDVVGKEECDFDAEQKAYRNSHNMPYIVEDGTTSLVEEDCEDSWGIFNEMFHE